MSDYPDAADLERIRSWEPEDPRDWFAYIQSVGKYWPDQGWGWSEEETTDDWDKPVRRYRISTGGWSGNEEIIGAMSANFIMWHRSWESTRRGGHYVFDIPSAARGVDEPPVPDAAMVIQVDASGVPRWLRRWLRPGRARGEA